MTLPIGFFGSVHRWINTPDFLAEAAVCLSKATPRPFPKRDLLALGGRLWVEVLEAARLDPGGLDEAIDVLRLEPDHPTEAVGRQVADVDEPVQGARRHAQPPSRVLR